jgi:amino acid adenylation domain-containing protein
VRGSCVHELFERQVSLTPDAIAVIDSAGELSYVELNARANRLAHRLRSLGVGPEVRVGVCLHRGIDMMVTLLAVLKAGGAYVPLDPDFPADRLAYMLTDSGDPLVITTHALAPDGPAELLYVPDVVSGPEDNPPALAHPGNAAYVMYTSGSTGQPKGVIVPHAGVVNRLLWGQQQFQYTTDDRVLQKTPYSFDVSLPELFGPLAAGATVVMAEPGGHRDSAYLVDVINTQRITTVHFVPSMLRAFLAESFDSLPTVRRMMCSGEALPADLVAAVHSRFTCSLYNLYGPTEASIEVTATECFTGEHVTIGREITNTEAYVLDDDLQPAAEGQLCLAGVQVARGYQNQPGLTAEKFVPNPFVHGGRLYLTGDLVRRLPDGTIDYLGRIDHQVKIRGNRVELGEIESALVAGDSISAAVVTMDKEKQRLIAYLVGSAEVTLDLAAVRARIARRLPEYMIPSVWITLDALPLTSSGKTDLKALPDPGSGRPALTGPYVPPRTETEKRLAEIWETVLDLSPVGVHDGFLDLGGQSLAGTRICARVRQAFCCRLSLDELMTTATVEQLAMVIESTEPEQIDGSIAVAENAPLSFAQQGVWLADQIRPGNTRYNLFEAYRVRGDLSETALRQALSDVIARHDSLRTTFQQVRGVPYQVVAPEVALPFTVVGTDDFESAVDTEISRPFSLAEGPLLRMTLVRLAADDHVVIVVMHHIVSDDWSLDVFWRDLSACYQARLAGTPGDLAPLPAQYADYATRQRDSLRADEHLAFWRNALAGAPLVLELPVEPDPDSGSSEAVVTFTLPAATSSAVSALARSAGVTTFMTLMAAFAATIHLATGKDDFLVGTFAGNRSAVDTEDLIGLFVNPLALRMDCSGDRSFTQLLSRVRATALDAFRHQELPFDQVISALRPPRDLTRHPVVQVAFQALGSRDRLVLPGLSTAGVRAGQGGNSFDVLAIVRENDGTWDGELHFRPEKFGIRTAQALADSFTRIVTLVTQEPNRRLSGLL